MPTHTFRPYDVWVDTDDRSTVVGGSGACADDSDETYLERTIGAADDLRENQAGVSFDFSNLPPLGAAVINVEMVFRIRVSSDPDAVNHYYRFLKQADHTTFAVTAPGMAGAALGPEDRTASLSSFDYGRLRNAGLVDVALYAGIEGAVMRWYEVALELTWDWVTPGALPTAEAGKLYFNLDDAVVGCLDTSTGETTYLGPAAPGLPDATAYGAGDPDAWQFGAPIQLPDGRVIALANVPSGTNPYPVGLVVAGDLGTSSAETWTGRIRDDGNAARMQYSEPRSSGGVWDSDGTSTWIQWSDSHTVAFVDPDFDSPSLSRFDATGDQVEFRGHPGDTDGNYIVPSGGAYEIHDGYFWRGSDSNGTLNKVSLTTDDPIQAAILWREDPSNPEFNRIWDAWFLGVHPDQGVLWLLYDRFDEMPGDGTYYVVSWNDLFWRNFGDFHTPAPEEFPGFPDLVWPIDQPLEDLDTLPYRMDAMGFGASVGVLRGDLAYYFITRDSGEGDWGEFDGTAYGSATRLHSLNVVTGERAEVAVLPYAFINDAGEQVNGNEDWSWSTDSMVYGLSGFFGSTIPPSSVIATAPPLRRLHRPGRHAFGGTATHLNDSTRQGSIRRGPSTIL